MNLLLWPNPKLKQVCLPVTTDDPKFKAQLHEMVELARQAGGIGLAANQVGIMKRLVVALGPGAWRKFVNPRILSRMGDRVPMDEGCLSVPGIFVPVPRYEEIAIESMDANGTMVFEIVKGRLAHILQHEIEHLDGRILADRLKPGQRDQLRAALRKGVRR